MTTDPDAVEALAFAIADDVTNLSIEPVKKVLKRLDQYGFTIAPIGVAEQPEQQSCPAQQPPQRGAMTDAELEREARKVMRHALPSYVGGACVQSQENYSLKERNHVAKIIELAKKYRG